MNTFTVLWVIALSAAGTFLIRYLPMRWQEKGAGQEWMRGPVGRALDAIGPAAIVALIVVSCGSLLGTPVSVRDGVALVLGLVAVALGKKILHSIAGATLAGVLIYGLVVWGLSLLP
ncbi:AzlD domain-containing protein [Paralcaligenes ureilyticus]|uniref:Branched-subunit amino acid transport protein AzlD n=1 Tax=Paralcaligenes ureilyticus TaxID=627131 RepID=A0A4R3LNC3_9BURK|nr:AzlD domain-containing protein [Paralcaligenes ureilyticus]TCT01631.1 branched-subunit amino acid transport protein AzlD [Paralcaligenes ureilyticus]